MTGDRGENIISFLPADAMKRTQLHYDTGWYPEEHDGTQPFRWMKKAAALSIKKYPVSGKKYLCFKAEHSHPDEKTIQLKLFLNGSLKGETAVDSDFSTYAFPFEERGDLQFEFRASKDYKAPGDPRELSVKMIDIKVVIPEEAGLFLEGWYEWEHRDFFSFRWIKKRAKINLASPESRNRRYLSFFIFSEYSDFSQRMTVTLDGNLLSEIQLLPKWNFYSLPLRRNLSEAAVSQDEPDVREIDLEINKQFFLEDDRRELAIRVGPPLFHDQKEQHDNFLFLHENALRNHEEMLAGKTELESFPPNLGVDLYGKCNIKPPCVYCLWDRMKVLEGEYVDTPVDESTLAEYGPFFRSARLVINCSFGEPLLHPRFGEILAFCQKHNKILELSTNGQAFSRRTIEALVGKPVYLYISLDAATKETYQKIRNDRWETILPNLLRLNEERKKKNNLPKIYMVFMPMRVNKDDLEPYFQLCQKVEAEALVLRPLNYLENPQIEVDRAGYHFNYEKELLPPSELEGIFQKCDEYSAEYGVQIANQFSFGIQEDTGPKTPLTPEKQRF